MKKILIPIMVIIAGIMLGIIFSIYSSSENPEPDPPQPLTSSPSQPEQANSQTNELDVNVVAQPKEVPHNPALEPDFKGANKITLNITYSNNTDSDLTGIQAEIFTTSSFKYQAGGSNTAKPNRDLTLENRRLTFDLTDAKAGETQEASVVIYPLEAKTAEFIVVIRSNEGREARSKPASVSAR